MAPSPTIPSQDSGARPSATLTTTLRAEHRDALREALVRTGDGPRSRASASSNPRGATSRTRGARPAVHRMRPIALLAVPALALSAAGAGWALRPAPAPHQQLVSWTAVPKAAPTEDPDQVTYWTNACEKITGSSIGLPEAAADASAADVHHHVLIDRRGGSFYCVDFSLGDGTESDPSVALSGLHEAGGQDNDAAWAKNEAFTPPTGDQVMYLFGDPIDIPIKPDADSYSEYGLVGPDVTGVQVVLANGERITASVQNGIWGVWWPTSIGNPVHLTLHVTTTHGHDDVAAEDVRAPDDTAGSFVG